MSDHELTMLGLTGDEKKAVLALQVLVTRSYPELPKVAVRSSNDIASVYAQRLGGLVTEVILAVALDGRNNLIGELAMASGGAHGASVSLRDILRPLIRMGASAFILVHNHPSGDPCPSQQDIALTRGVAEAAQVVGIPLVDHVIVAARGGGYSSLLDLGILTPHEGRS